MSRLSEALERLKAGGMIIVVDDIDRENEGDLVMAAEHVDAAALVLRAQRCLAPRPLARAARHLEHDRPRPAQQHEGTEVAARGVVLEQDAGHY